MLSIDLVANEVADLNVLVAAHQPWEEQSRRVSIISFCLAAVAPAPAPHTRRQADSRAASPVGGQADGQAVRAVLAPDLPAPAIQATDDVTASLAGDKLSAVICVAGGWAGGNAADDSELCKHRVLHPRLLTRVLRHHMPPRLAAPARASMVMLRALLRGQR